MSTNKRVLLVVNPISGGRDKEPITELIKKKVAEKKWDLKSYSTQGVQDKEHLSKLVQEYQPDRILSVGGDGTIKLLAEILKGDPVPLGVIPAGSANGLAENLDLPTDPEALTDIALGPHFAALDTVIINDELCIHISDLGLNAALIKNYQEGNVRGKLGYLIQSIPTLIKSDFPFQFKLEHQGRILHRQGVLLAITNTRKYGTGSTINPGGKYNDGLFEVLIFKEFNIPEILKTFGEEVNLSKDFVEIFATSEVKITSNRKIPFQIDGEYRGEVRTVHARISPFQILFAVPEEKSTETGMDPAGSQSASF